MQAFNPYLYNALFVSNYDADSLTLTIDLGFGIWKHNQKIRLYGINAPELRGSQKEQGIKARDFVRELLKPGDAVILESHKDKSGKYGRWLGVIWLADGRSLNQILVEEEFAVEKFY